MFVNADALFNHDSFLPFHPAKTRTYLSCCSKYCLNMGDFAYAWLCYSSYPYPCFEYYLRRCCVWLPLASL